MELVPVGWVFDRFEAWTGGRGGGTGWDDKFGSEFDPHHNRGRDRDEVGGREVQTSVEGLGVQVFRSRRDDTDVETGVSQGRVL